MVWNPVLGCKYYRTEAGGQPVKDWIRALAKGARLIIGKDISKVQYLWPDVRKPLIDGFGRGLYEVRSTHDKNDYRVLFCIQERTMVLLHALKKGTGKTPKGDIELARKRQKEVGK